MCAITKLKQKGSTLSQIKGRDYRDERGNGDRERGEGCDFPKGAVYWEGESFGGGGSPVP